MRRPIESDSVVQPMRPLRLPAESSETYPATKAGVTIPGREEKHSLIIIEPDDRMPYLRAGGTDAVLVAQRCAGERGRAATGAERGA